MGNKDSGFLYFLAAVALGGLYFLGKQKGKQGTAATTVEVFDTANTSDEVKSIAQTIKDVFSAVWFFTSSDFESIKTAMSHILDANGYKAVAESYGNLSAFSFSFNYVSGGLDNWLRQLPDDERDQLRQYSFGSGSF